MNVTLRKYSLIALLIMLTPIVASAQKQDSISKHNLFADMGFTPGVSFTYSYIFHKHFGMGIGCQGYIISPTVDDAYEFVTAIYGDMRFYIHPRANGFFFILMDMGIDFYKHYDNEYLLNNGEKVVTLEKGVELGLGFGHFWHMTKRGGFYMSLKTVGNAYTPKTLLPLIDIEGSIAFSVGYKF